MTLMIPLDEAVRILAAAVVEARAAGIEEAAQTCEAAHDRHFYYGASAISIAAAIRALIDQKPPPDDAMRAIGLTEDMGRARVPISEARFSETPRDLLTRAILRGAARWIPDPDPLSRKANLAIGETRYAAEVDSEGRPTLDGHLVAALLNALDKKPPEAG